MFLLALRRTSSQFIRGPEDSCRAQPFIKGAITMSGAWYVKVVMFICPLRSSIPQDCREAFVRLQQFQSHFEHAHRELVDKRVSVDALAPFAILAPPRRLRPPPPFPDHKTQAELFLTPVSIPPVRRGRSQTTASQGISRRWSRLNVQDDESDGDPIVFDDLSSLQSPNISKPEVVYIEVQRKLPLDRQPLLSRPQPVIYPPVRCNSPEQIILYPRFVRMVDKLVATGTLAGHKEGEM